MKLVLVRDSLYLNGAIVGPFETTNEANDFILSISQNKRYTAIPAETLTPEQFRESERNLQDSSK